VCFLYRKNCKQLWPGREPVLLNSDLDTLQRVVCSGSVVTEVVSTGVRLSVNECRGAKSRHSAWYLAGDPCELLAEMQFKQWCSRFTENVWLGSMFLSGLSAALLMDFSYIGPIPNLQYLYLYLFYYWKDFFITLLWRLAGCPLIDYVLVVCDGVTDGSWMTCGEPTAGSAAGRVLGEWFITPVTE